LSKLYNNIPKWSWMCTYLGKKWRKDIPSYVQIMATNKSAEFTVGTSDYNAARACG